MQVITIHYHDTDTAPERLKMMAQEHGIIPEMLAKRLISEGLGDYGLVKLSPEEQDGVRSLKDLAEKTGLRKKNELNGPS